MTWQWPQIAMLTWIALTWWQGVWSSAKEKIPARAAGAVIGTFFKVGFIGYALYAGGFWTGAMP